MYGVRKTMGREKHGKGEKSRNSVPEHITYQLQLTRQVRLCQLVNLERVFCCRGACLFVSAARLA